MERKLKQMALSDTPKPMSLPINDLPYTLSFFFLLFQAQRDYFGAHTYELLSDPGKFVHTNWTGLGGTVSATTYDA